MPMAATLIRIRSATSFSSYLRTECLKQDVRRITPLQNRRTLKTSVPKIKPSDFAFVFDVDGVLLRSSDPLPRASKSLNFLQGNRIPFVLLTNGGGKLEKDRVAELSDQLQVPLDTSMFVQSHTPFAGLVHGEENGTVAMKDQCILVVGGEGDNCRKVAENYGFTNVITTADIIKASPQIMPFAHSMDYYASYARPLKRPIHQDEFAPIEGSLKIDAIFVFNDSRDWALDIQIILDLLLSERGVLGTVSRLNSESSLPNNGFQQDGQPALYFSNPDVLWAAEYHLPRLGQGGFREALEGIWTSLTGGEAAGVTLQKHMFGKPHQATFEFAEKRLIEHREELFASMDEEDGKNELKNVYMVGDNPDSDILGANTYRSPHDTIWSSILVLSGVYNTTETPSFHPIQTVNDVWDAVKWGLQRSKWDRGGS